MGNTNSVKNHYENASRTGVFTLKAANIKEFPRQLLQLSTSIRSVDLSNNKIKELPGFIGEFSSLKNLVFQSNLLTYLPKEIASLTKLETLSLGNNRLMSIPDDLSTGLSSLRSVDLSGNLLDTFPMAFVGLKALETLDLSRNKITSIPDGVQTLQVLELNLNQNQISTVSKHIASCKRLKVLRLEENCLSLDSIPQELLTSSPVSLLAIDGNQFKLKQFQELPGHDVYLERFTATKKKMI
ncbi:leucine-rich repeat-containing protein 57-like isoform X2 [Brevipalpus obovatus]|uniref:leucine-rich repeat-containing protein 57-like isoform X2 n=1 Tax=Brevipalpus obovatus TaxID=246614 RepID=UPI003D9F2433